LALYNLKGATTYGTNMTQTKPSGQCAKLGLVASPLPQCHQQHCSVHIVPDTVRQGLASWASS